MEEEIKARQNRRLNYLIEVYKSYNQKPGYSVNGDAIARSMGMDLVETNSIIKYLSDRRLIEVRFGAATLGITSYGQDYVEEHFVSNEKEELDPLFDELLERLKRLELGQQIIYDGLYDEIQEVKDLIGKLSKKNLGEILTGKLVNLGLGQVAKEIVEAIQETFKDQNLLPQ